MSRPTGRRVLAIALPVILSNATVPLQGAVDVAVIGRTEAAAALAAVGLGAQIFGLLFGVCNFLQMGSAGLTARALGAGERGRVVDTLLRALLVAFALAALMIAAQWLVLRAGLGLFEASPEAEALTGAYFGWRIWGAPAELGLFALMGWFSGQALTARLLQLQLVVSLGNIGLNLLFVLGLGWGVEGVALATALASWAGLLTGLALARRRAGAILPADWRAERARLLDPAALARLMRLNRDLFIRSLCLIGGFAWMTRLGSLQGDAILAANVVLWQFFLITAYALDGFAMAAETLVGQAAGAGDRDGVRRAALVSTLWSGGLACSISAGLALFSGTLIDLFTTDAAIRTLARDYALWGALSPAVGFAAFQMDGIFVGLTAAHHMRNGMLASVALYLPLSWWGLAAHGNHGLWAASWAFLLIRAAALLALWRPALRTV